MLRDAFGPEADPASRATRLGRSLALPSARLIVALALSVLLVLVVVTACWCVPDGADGTRGGAAPSRQAGTEPGHYDGDKAGTEPGHYDNKATSGEKDFLASLESTGKPALRPFDGPGAQDEPAREPSTYVTLLRFSLSLALVLGLAYATILGLKRFTGLRTVTGRGQTRIRVIENTPLGASRALHLVEVGKRRFVVGSTASQVNLITEVEPDELPDTGTPQPAAGFKEQLAGFLGTKPDPSTSSGLRMDAAAGPSTLRQARGSGVARMLRDSTAYLHDMIGRVGALRGRLRDA